MDGDVVKQLTNLRQYRADGHRAPHKPLLVLLALGQLANSGSSRLEWSSVEQRLGALLAEFGTPSKQGASSAAYPFTRLRADGVWQLSRDVPNDSVGALNSAPIEGFFTAEVETALLHSPATLDRVARDIVESQFPLSLAPDVLTAVGLNPELAFGLSDASRTEPERKRSASWRNQIVAAWDRSCAFCGFDGALGGAPVGIEAAHVRWFNFEGPDDLDNGLALCSLHHKLFDRGALGFADPGTLVVSSRYSATSSAGRNLYDLHGRELRPRPGTKLPSQHYVDWHTLEVFKGEPLSA